jgi:23S rRNA (guanine2445-N2)-methyltransferase / 23S rRNA (guanine2069-N7)-methyltransferase
MMTTYFSELASRQRGDAQYERFDGAAKFHEILEGSVKLLVNFEDYLDTGLFLDHRPIRQRIAREAAGKDFLNLFAYTGTATVHAAKGGAASTTSVDMSRTYLDWAQRNLQKNGYSGSRHNLVQENCLTWLERQKGGQYDLIFLDPPSFSNSKRMQEAFDIQRDHEALIQAALKLLRKNGTLYFSTNLRKFKLDARLSQTATVTNISAETIPFDFKRRQNIHHTFKIQASTSSKSAS